jgi:anaerobic magnesium-protoporphyrin IX monomethyl ester cyclase
MRILLILPSGGRSLFYPPLGIAYLATRLNSDGHFVRILDFECMKGKYVYTKDGYSLSLPQNVNDVSETIMQNEYSSFCPDVVGIHVHCGNVLNSFKAIEYFLEKSVSVVLGGPEVTENYFFFLEKYPKIIGVIRGEGDIAFSQLINVLGSSGSLTKLHINNFTYIENGKITCTEHTLVEIEKLPFPKWELFDLSLYSKIYNRLVLPVQLSRGCPYRCYFCTVNNTQSYRHRKLSRFYNEIENNILNYNCNLFRFNDSTFNRSKKDIFMFSNMVGKLKCKIKWGAYSRVESIDEQTAYALKSSGCYYLYLGIESGSDKILNFMNKGIKRDQIMRAISCLKKNNIKILCSIIIGYPGESNETIEDTIDLIKIIKPNGVYVFPFELRENTLIQKLFSTMNVQEDNYLKTSRMIYGRLMPREIITWQNTNAIFNWIDILNKTNEIKDYIKEEIEENLGEEDLIYMMCQD